MKEVPLGVPSNRQNQLSVVGFLGARPTSLAGDRMPLQSQQAGDTENLLAPLPVLSRVGTCVALGHMHTHTHTPAGPTWKDTQQDVEDGTHTEWGTSPPLDTRRHTHKDTDTQRHTQIHTQ